MFQATAKPRSSWTPTPSEGVSMHVRALLFCMYFESCCDFFGDSEVADA